MYIIRNLLAFLMVHQLFYNMNLLIYLLAFFVYLTILKYLDKFFDDIIEFVFFLIFYVRDFVQLIHVLQFVLLHLKLLKKINF